MKARIIAIANQKGGVGKTTTTFNLGAALALKHDKKILLIDLDPQANLTEYLRYQDDEAATMTDLISSVAGNIPVTAETVRNAIRRNEENNLDYIPADINLANAETVMTTALARETVLKRIIGGTITEDYDFILIDCLPSLGILLINALTAADSMIIPVQTQKFSMDGLHTLTSLYEQIRDTINPSLHLLGVLPTMTDNTNISRTARDTLTDQYDGSIFGTSVHKSIEAAKSSESGKALCRTKNRLGDEYTALAEEVIRRCSE